MIKPTHDAVPSLPPHRHTAHHLFITFSFLLLSLVGVGCSSIAGKEAASQNDRVPWPTFSDPDAQDYMQSCSEAWEKAYRSLKILERRKLNTPTDILTGINQLEILINEPTGWAGLYANVHPNEFMRTAGEVCEQRLMALSSEINLSRPLYKKLMKVDIDSLEGTERYYADQTRQWFELAGVGLNEQERGRVQELNAEIVKLGQEFLTNIRSDNQVVELSASDLKGLPEDYVASKEINEQGNVQLSTNYPDYFPLMQYAVSDEAKRKMYVAFRQRGYPANKAVLHKLLSARYELAKLLGFDHFADYITADKMMGSAANATSFINQMTELATARANQDYAVLLQRLKQIHPEATAVGDWQKIYLENLVRNEAYSLDQQEVRQYFSFAKVKNGVFQLVKNLFDVQITPWQTNVWHPSVEAYEVRENGQLLGRFYLDMHPRTGKYQHAAQFGIRDGVQNVQIPMAALVCNFPGGEGGSDLLEHAEVETFLHEFGHLIHTIFGGHVPWVRFAGTNTQRDFVEAPSQMLEEWVWDAATLKSFASNERNETIPDELVEKMNRARNFGKGLQVRHQMFYAALSLNYYNRDPKELDLDQMMTDLQKRYSPFPYVEDTYMYASFGHLDNYSAIYYTYMWSQVIAADMFREFKQNGLQNKAVAARYRNTVLAPGASRPAAQLVEDFLGRPFNFEAFGESLHDGQQQ